MSGDEEFDLFGELSPEEQYISADMRKRLCDTQQLPASPRSLLAAQRLRYLQSSRKVDNATEACNTLRNSRPLNFGLLFTTLERQSIIDSVYEHAHSKGWSAQRHGAFPTRDIPVKEISVSDLIYARLSGSLFPFLQHYTGIDVKYWTFRDLFVVGYHEDHQRALELHSDGCLASLTLLLNETSYFDGGGTFFEKFNLHIAQNPGDAWVHDGKLRHSGVEISRGQRLVMVAFMDTQTHPTPPSFIHWQRPSTLQSPVPGYGNSTPPCSATHFSKGVWANGRMFEAGRAAVLIATAQIVTRMPNAFMFDDNWFITVTEAEELASKLQASAKETGRTLLLAIKVHINLTAGFGASARAGNIELLEKKIAKLCLDASRSWAQDGAWRRLFYELQSKLSAFAEDEAEVGRVLDGLVGLDKVPVTVSVSLRSGLKRAMQDLKASRNGNDKE
ncbi:hypothetical protein H4S08_001950 [Coemansia sp. RSA 1365]|nr:hypothetical protein H4S08_001950 [Coemansia sp. RSA 1365]